MAEDTINPILSGDNVSTSASQNQENIVTNPGAVTPIKEQTEREATAEATPITYSQRELLLLIRNYLVDSNLTEAASVLTDEAKLETPSSVVAPSSLAQQPSTSSSVVAPSSLVQQPSTSSSLVAPSSLVQQPSTLNPDQNTLHSIVVEYLKTQHSLCENPFTTLPTFSLLHPHISLKRNDNSNVTSKLATNEIRRQSSGMYRKFVYSRFKPTDITSGDDEKLYTCIASFENCSLVVAGTFGGALKFFKHSHGTSKKLRDYLMDEVTVMQSFVFGGSQFLLTSCATEVRLLNVSSYLRDEDKHMKLFEHCRAARINHSKKRFAALSTEATPCEILLYDIETSELLSRFSDTASNFSDHDHRNSIIHFSCSDSQLLWNGVLWDLQTLKPIHRFDNLSSFGGGGFHPDGNQVIINSEVWDIRNFGLLKTVPSLDQTTITFNARGDVIYAIPSRDTENVVSAYHEPRVQHPLFKAFLTLDAANYSDIATTSVGDCVLDLATEPTDSYVGILTMSYWDGFEEGNPDHREDDFLHSTFTFYEIGKEDEEEDAAV